MIYNHVIRNGNRLDAAAQEIQIGDYISYRTKTRSNIIHRGIVTGIGAIDPNDCWKKNIKVVEAVLHLEKGVASFEELTKRSLIAQNMLVKINDFACEPVSEFTDSTNRDLSVGDFVALTDYNKSRFDFGYVVGLDISRKKSATVQHCLLTDENGPLEFILYKDFESFDPSHLVKVTGAEKNWDSVSSFDEASFSSGIMQKVINGQPSGPMLDGYGNPVTS